MRQKGPDSLSSRGNYILFYTTSRPLLGPTPSSPLGSGHSYPGDEAGGGWKSFFYILQSVGSVKGYVCMTRAFCRRFLIAEVLHSIPGYCIGNFGGFAKLRKSTISFVMSVRLSAWYNLLLLGGYSWNSILEYFSKIPPENSSWIEIWQE